MALYQRSSTIGRLVISLQILSSSTIMSTIWLWQMNPSMNCRDQNELRKEIDWVGLTEWSQELLTTWLVKDDDCNSYYRLYLFSDCNEIYLSHTVNFESPRIRNQRLKLWTTVTLLLAGCYQIQHSLLPWYDTHCFNRVPPVQLQC